MTVPFLRFPDVQRILVDSLTVLAGVGHVAIETPANLADLMPFVRVVRTGGSASWVSAVPHVDVDVFAGSYLAAEQLAEQIREYLVGPPPGPVLLDRVDCTLLPRELPWDDDGLVRRFGAEFDITVRRRVTT